MIYKKLIRTRSYGELDYIPNLKKVFPELKKLNDEELGYRFKELKLDFYHKEETPVTPWVRITLPFAMIVMLIMIIGVPINFMITGTWGYSIKSKIGIRIYNWFNLLNISRI